MPNRNVNLAAEFKSSGKTQRAFCADRRISINTLRYHLYKKGKRSRSLPSPVKPPAVSAAPAFLSFNGGQFIGNSSRSHVTIIAGSFTIAEIAELVSGALRP